MGKCRSSQEVMTDHILQEKWSQAVTSCLIEQFEDHLRNRPINVSELEEFLSESAMKTYHFRSAGVLKKRFLETVSKTKTLLKDDAAFDTFWKSLQQRSIKISSVFLPTDG